MILVKNEFDLLVNSFYQSFGLSKGYKAYGMFGIIELLPEHDYHRNSLKNQQFLYNAINKSNSGEFEISLIKLKLKEIYDIQDWWFKELEQSINRFPNIEQNMVSFRIIFQSASDTLHKLTGLIISNMDPSIEKNAAIDDVVNQILNMNYWEGGEVLRDVNSSRQFKNALNLSNEWVSEYIRKLFKN